MSDIRFSDLTLSQPVLDALAEMGYETPTPVQESAVPMATTGQDLMVQSQTGTGKTAAFGIPLIETLEADKGIKGLVLARPVNLPDRLPRNSQDSATSNR